jgi:Predicted sugar phosphate isomerase
MSVLDLLNNINREDRSVPLAIEKVIPKIEPLVVATVEKMKHGGRLVLYGAGTADD